MTYGKPNQVAYVVGREIGAADGVFLVKMPDGVPQALLGTAAIIWLAAIDGVDPIADLVAATGESAEVVGPVVAEFLDSLVKTGLLEVHDD